MNQNPNTPEEEFKKQKRLVLTYLFISLAIQVIVLIIYYFREKQVTLAFPMLLGIFVTVATIFPVTQLGKKD